MKRKNLAVFLRNAAVFLAFWAIMCGVLTYSNWKRVRETVVHISDEGRQRAAYDTEEVLDGTAPREEKGTIVAWRLTYNNLEQYGGAMITRVRWAGVELARSQMSMGAIALPGTHRYDHYLLFDPVLTDEEQVALAHTLKADHRLNDFYGGKESYNGALYGEVTGIPQGNMIYPQRLTLFFEGGPVTVMESGSPIFRDAELVTLRFDGAMLISCLVGGSHPDRGQPERILKQYRRAEAELNRLLEEHEISSGSAASVGGAGFRAEGGTVARTEIVVCSGYAYRDFDLAVYGMENTYALTLFAALLLALLITRIQLRALQRERDFTNAAAHELRTPLAVLRAHAESLREDIAPEKREAYLSVILDEADRMDALAGELLALSRLEAGAEKRPGAPVELSEVVRASFDRLSLPLAEKEICLTLALDPGAVAGDREKLGRLVDNLASNALRHCPPGGAIRVRLERKRSGLRLTVENDGDPIPEEDLSRIWEPFYRGDRARGRDTGGAGLGLALVRQIAAFHGGHCAAENLEGGVRFTVTVPALHSEV